ncbi:ATP-binding protein, partial [Nocardia sp. 2YAB30]|uniref:ATP-binding protein n=1 Tax=Nocardia sp. 2YAB30 TaxID=3233022 RepID=UPI003F9EA56E
PVARRHGGWIVGDEAIAAWAVRVAGRDAVIQGIELDENLNPIVEFAERPSIGLAGMIGAQPEATQGEDEPWITIAREEWELGQWDIKSLLPGNWPNPPRGPRAVRLISALLDDAFRHSRSARVALAQEFGSLHCTVAAEGRELPTPDLPGPQDLWVPELHRLAASWGFALHRTSPGREVSFVLQYHMDGPRYTPDWWAVADTDASGGHMPLDLATGVRIGRDQRQLIAEVRHAVVRLAGVGRSQTLFPELAFSALVDNANRHTDGDVWVRARVSDRGVVRIEVADTSHRLPVLDQARSNHIAMVDDTADGWGVELHRRGKTVWFEYNIDRTAANPDSDARADVVAGVLDDSHDLLGEEVLRSGTTVEVAAWLRRIWHVELVGFDDPEASRDVARGLNHMLSEHRQFVVRNGAVIAVGKVGGDKGIDIVAHRDDHGRVFIESITVDPRLLGTPGEPAGRQLYASVVGAIGGVLVDAGAGVVQERGFQYLFSHYLGSRPEVGVDDETAFEEWARDQLDESVIKPRGLTRFGRRGALSRRFDVERAARAAVADVELNGWGNASDAARTLYRLLFAQLRIDPESVDLLDAAMPEFDRYAWSNWGKEYDNVSDLAAAFEAECGIRVVGVDIPGIDVDDVWAFFAGLRFMWGLFPDVEIRAAGISTKATPDENAGDGVNEIFINQEDLGGHNAHNVYDEARYRFASVMVAAAGSAVLDDVFPALLARWLHGRDNGRRGYEKEFGRWLRGQFSESSYPDSELDSRLWRDVSLNEVAALADSVVHVAGGGELTDGQRVLYSLLMKHLAPKWGTAHAERNAADAVFDDAQRAAEEVSEQLADREVRDLGIASYPQAAQHLADGRDKICGGEVQLRFEQLVGARKAEYINRLPVDRQLAVNGMT